MSKESLAKRSRRHLGVAPLLVVRLTHRKIKAEALPSIRVDGEMRFDAAEFQVWKKANWDADAFAFSMKQERR